MMSYTEAYARCRQRGLHRVADALLTFAMGRIVRAPARRDRYLDLIAVLIVAAHVTRDVMNRRAPAKSEPKPN